MRNVKANSFTQKCWLPAASWLQVDIISGRAPKADFTGNKVTASVLLVTEVFRWASH